MADGTVHLIRLVPSTTPKAFIQQLDNALSSTLIVKGTPYGWVHKPHEDNKDRLLSSEWNLFLLTDPQFSVESIQGSIAAHVEIPIMMPDPEYIALKQRINVTPTPSQGTPPLPEQWANPQYHIPASSLVETNSEPLGVGELRLDGSMVSFLGSAIPEYVRNDPVCFFNLFKYKNNDRSVHDSYMQGFKDNFGNAAGATVKFMGPVSDFGLWHDTNLVQYDTVWHYAYMLSTDVYKELNKEKVAGLDDTCILLVGEMELITDQE